MLKVFLILHLSRVNSVELSFILSLKKMHIIIKKLYVVDFDCNVIFNFSKKKIVNDLLFELMAFKFLLKIKRKKLKI